MSVDEAVLLLEHTGYDDFNLLEHQIKGRLEAIQVILKENQKYKETIDKAIDKLYCYGEILNADFQKDMLDILKEVK